MEKKLLLLYWLKQTRKRRNARLCRIAKQKQLQRQRLQQFYKQQSMERLLLVVAIILTIASFNTSAMVRTIWMKERSGDWYDNIVLGTFTHREWIENFRMTKETFLYICNELRSYIEKQDTKLRKAIPVDKRVAITLWRLASNADYRTIGHLFGVSKGSVCVINKEVCKAITATLSPRYKEFHLVTI